jgi:hypothetical protein
MMTMVISGSDGVTFPDSTNQFSGGAFSFKNRIINGDMRIDQRNAGASATNTGATTYYLDRWVSLGTTSAGQFSVQQDSDAPAGFSNSAKITVTTIDSSLAASDRYTWMQRLEGYTVSDFDFGKASAKTITLSFYVRSSVTGTFGAGIQNSTADRSYPFNYTISSADTWEYKTVTIPGDTTGTWPTDNSRSLVVLWALGVGSDREGTANTWAAGNFYSTSGSSNLMATLDATWYITGVQLEVGSVATPFERRPYGTELMLCQRYYAKITGAADAAIGSGSSTATDIASVYVKYPTTMRSGPTISQSSTKISDARTYSRSVTSLNATFVSTDSARVDVNTASGMSVDRPALFQFDGANGFIAFSSEL